MRKQERPASLYSFCRLLIELSERKDSEGASSSPDFVLCIGDDRSDEDMFTAVEHVTVAANGLEEVRLRGRGGLDANKMGTLVYWVYKRSVPEHDTHSCETTAPTASAYFTKLKLMRAELQAGRPPVRPSHSAAVESPTESGPASSTANPPTVANGRGSTHRKLVPLARIKIPSDQVMF